MTDSCTLCGSVTGNKAKWSYNSLRICTILKKRYRCYCSRPQYCTAVTNLVTLVHEACEAEHEEEAD